MLCRDRLLGSCWMGLLPSGGPSRSGLFSLPFVIHTRISISIYILIHNRCSAETDILTQSQISSPLRHTQRSHDSLSAPLVFISNYSMNGAVKEVWRFSSCYYLMKPTSCHNSAQRREGEDEEKRKALAL